MRWWTLIILYLLSISAFYQILIFRARLHHELLWRPHFLRTYPISDRISTLARGWYIFQPSSPVQSPPHVSDDEDPTICIAIDAFHRQGSDYLPETIGSLLQPLTPSQRERIHLIVRFKEETEDLSQQTGHPELTPLLAKQLADEVYVGIERIYPSEVLMDDRDLWITLYNSAIIPYPNRWDSEGVVDYAHAIHTCLQTRAEYILILEDDVVAQSWWFKRLKEVVIPDLEKITKEGRRWINVSFFWECQYLGWEAHHTPWMTRMIFSVYVSALVIIMAFRRVVGPRTAVQPILTSTGDLTPSAWTSGTSSKRRRSRTCWILFHLSLPLLLTPHLILYFLQGRHAAFPIPLVLSRFNACCAQSLLFSRDSAKYARDNLISEGFGDERWPTPRDKALWILAELGEWERWVYKPALWQHLGAVSGKGFEDKDRIKNWGFELELLE